MAAAVVRAGLVVVGAGAAVVLAAGAAQAAPQAPSGRASCVGQVFVPQATGAPGTVAARIAEIKRDLLLEGESFGDPISGLARDTWCRA